MGTPPRDRRRCGPRSRDGRSTVEPRPTGLPPLKRGVGAALSLLVSHRPWGLLGWEWWCGRLAAVGTAGIMGPWTTLQAVVESATTRGCTRARRRGHAVRHLHRGRRDARPDD